MGQWAETDFRLEILGSGGAFRTPRPGCRCRVCTGARRHGVPWERWGPSVFVHGPNILIDTPEESALQVDRAGIDDIAHGHVQIAAQLHIKRGWDVTFAYDTLVVQCASRWTTVPIC